MYAGSDALLRAQSGRFHIGQYLYRFDPVELTAGDDDQGGRVRRRRSPDDDETEYRMSSTLVEHREQFGM